MYVLIRSKGSWSEPLHMEVWWTLSWSEEWWQFRKQSSWAVIVCWPLKRLSLVPRVYGQTSQIVSIIGHAIGPWAMGESHPLDSLCFISLMIDPSVLFMLCFHCILIAVYQLFQGPYLGFFLPYSVHWRNSHVCQVSGARREAPCSAHEIPRVWHHPQS